jgi:uncharacterized protein (TIGR03437 family)
MRKILLVLMTLPALALWGADTNTPIVVSAASPLVGVAPDSLASIYGSELARETASAGNPPWPTSLGGMPGVSLIDSAGRNWTLPLVFASPSQMNVWIPAGVAAGQGKVEFPYTNVPPGVTAALRIVPVNIRKTAPGVFTMNGEGTGVAAATAIAIAIPTPMQFPVPVFTCDASNACTAVPIDPGIDRPVILSFYGTGIRGASKVTVTIGSQTFTPTYAGPQPTVPGLDQVNVPLSLNLRGAGLVNVAITADGVSSNAGQIDIQ